MNLFMKRFMFFSVLLVLAAGLCFPAAGQINVTLQLNTATNLDTLGENHFVEVRGELNGQAPGNLPDGNVIDWSANSTLELTNTGGDYWEITFQMNPNDTIKYKFWTGFDPTMGTYPDGGWEGPFNAPPGFPPSVDTRVFVSGISDTLVPLQYYHPNVGGGQVDQYWRPFPSKPDSVAIYFRVNMAGKTEQGVFDPSVHGPVGVRGDPSTSGGTLDWGVTKVLMDLETAGIDSAFWSGVAYFPKDSVTASTNQEYKFYVENDPDLSWESISNRVFSYPQGLKDTTLHWRYFDNESPTGGVLFTANVIWRADVQALKQLGLFDRGVGDELKVIGPNGFSVPGDFIDMQFNPALNEWNAQTTLTRLTGTDVNYKYYIVWDSSRVDSTSPNYIPNLELGNGWEEPGLTGGGNRIFEFQQIDPQTVPGDYSQDKNYFDGIPKQGVINTPLTVTFNIDMTPATDPNVNPNQLFRPGIDSVWIQFDGSLVAITQGLASSGEDARFLITDTNGDMVYSGDMVLQLPGWYQFPFIVAYGTDTSAIITNGGGFEAGRRYYQFVQPDVVHPDLTVDWPSSYQFPVLPWKDQDLPHETPPNLFVPSAIGDEDVITQGFELMQNYPNPFNPETTIQYQVAKTSQVEINIYNIRGQLVKTLVDKKRNTGEYKVVWKGDNNNGVRVASGIYFVKMNAGDFSKVRKLTLLK